MKHPLSNEKLGEHGENYFSSLCSHNAIICNKSVLDRMGWDFIVELENENAIESYDLSPSTKRFFVQVKTVWANTNVIQLKLSAAKLLAQNEMPSLIYVVKFNDYLEVVDSFFIHLIDKPLGKTLKRLRKESAAGTMSLNKKRISFSARKKLNRPLVDTTNIKNTLGQYVKSMPEYIDQKTKQLKTLGFEAIQLNFTCTFDLSKNKKGLVKFWLGEVEQPVEKLKKTEIRFGIPIELDLFGENSTITLTPEPEDGFSLSLDCGKIAVPIIFEGTLSRTPIELLLTNVAGVKIGSPFIKVIFYLTDSMMNFTIIAPPTSLNLPAWKNYTSLRICFLNEDTSIALTSPKGSFFNIPFDFPAAKENLRDDQEYFSNLLDTILLLEELEKKSRIAPKDYTFDEVCIASEKLEQFQNLIADDKPGYLVKIILKDPKIYDFGKCQKIGGLVTVVSTSKKLFAVFVKYKRGEWEDNKGIIFSTRNSSICKAQYLGEVGMSIENVQKAYENFQNSIADEVSAYVVHVTDIE